MGHIYLVQGRSAPDMIEDVKNGLTFLARKIAEFPGATRYEYYQSIDDPTVFYFFSIWQSEEDFQRYVTSDTHQEYLNMLPPGAWEEGRKRTKLTALT